MDLWLRKYKTFLLFFTVESYPTLPNCSFKAYIIKSAKNTGGDCKKSVYKNFANFETLLKKTPAQMLCCEICKVFKRTYFKNHLTSAFENKSETH